MTTFLVGLSGELAVKARATRAHFLNKLWKNLQERARVLSIPFSIEERGMRYIIQAPREMASLLATHPGISWYAPALVGEKETLSWIEELQHHIPPTPFTYFVFMEKVEDPRDMELSKGIKETLMRILEEAKRERSLANYNHPLPHLEVRGEIRDRVYLYWQKEKGMGGLPMGTASPSLALLSGGPDSLLATLLIARRGSLPQGVHFHYGHGKREIIEDQARVLAWFMPQMRFTLHWVDYQPLLEALKERGPKRHLCLLCKALMLRIATRIAKAQGLEALVTGDILGEQASQTLPSLAFISREETLPLIRPLIAFNKEEVFLKLKEWGLYHLATHPPPPCPYPPSHPVTKPRLKKDYQGILEELEGRVKITQKTYRAPERLS